LEGGEELPVEFVDDNTAVVRGELNIDEVNEALDIDLPEGEEFETIAGFIFNRAGRLVEEGESFRYDDVELTVERVENTRILKARVGKLVDEAAVATGGDGGDVGDGATTGEPAPAAEPDAEP
ncbi:MAG: transporter associated domain-containing protein, partial [Halobacteriaceae archaeon]